MSDSSIVLSKDTIFVDELIRENARLTVQHEADQAQIRELRERASSDELEAGWGRRWRPAIPPSWRPSSRSPNYTGPWRIFMWLWPGVTLARCVSTSARWGITASPGGTGFDFGGGRMNWKREAVDKLKNYEAHREALESIPKEIKRLESVFTGIRGAATDGTPVSGGTSTREDMMLTNIVHRDELRRRLKEARLWISQVDKALAVLGDEERLVLDKFYIHRAKGTVEDLCERLSLEKTAVYDRREKALRHFTIALYGVTETE